MKDAIEAALRESIDVKQELLKTQLGVIEQMAEVLIGCVRRGGKILLCGNGGSAADAQHIAAELVGKLARDRRPLPAIALSTNTSILTAVGNDYGFEHVFARQVEALAASGDVLIALSTSGDSANVLEAVEVARTKGCRTLAFTGADGGRLKSAAEVCLTVPSTKTWHIQEAHITVGHVLCALVEKAVCGE